MRQISYREALREALREEMLRDENVFLIGEDIGRYGGAYGVTTGLIDEFGEERVRDTPISEIAIIGAGVGAALTGMRPVVEIMFMDFITISMEQIVNVAAKMAYLYDTSVPLVIRTPEGERGGGPVHSQCFEAWFIHVPGLKVAVPSTPYDAKGLLKASIRDDSPVIFVEHKGYDIKGPVPEDEYLIPLGKADVKRVGDDVTIIAISSCVYKALNAAEELSKNGIEAEVIDLRTLVPLDKQTILNSVRKTGRVVTVEEGCKTGGVGAEISAMIVEEAFGYLDAPIQRVAAIDSPIPHSRELVKHIIPDENKIIEAVRRITK